jgi:hypothetical protein
MNGGLEGFFRQTTADLDKARRKLEDDGRDFWIGSIRTGENVAGETLAALRELGRQNATPAPMRKSLSPAPQPTTPSGRSYSSNSGNASPKMAAPDARLGRGYSTPPNSQTAVPPSAIRHIAGPSGVARNDSSPQSLPPLDDMAEFRRQQAEFAQITRDIGNRNSWFAIPALAPAAVVLGLETAGAIGAEMAAPKAAMPPMQFVENEPYLRVGDNWQTRGGMRAHRAFSASVDAKPNWRSNPTITSKSGEVMRPDAVAREKYYLELKPNTPSGRSAGARQIKRYAEGGKRKARVVYYDPKDYQ